MAKIKNETGTFTIDDDGVLKKYQSTMDNEVQKNVWCCLDIPEGVRVIPARVFCDCEILERLTFPKSLRVISTDDAVYSGAFSRSRLPHVELPAALEELGNYAFAGSTMHSLRIPKGLKSEYGRQFKSSTIGTLYLPEDFRAEGTHHGFRESHEWGKELYGYIRSMNVNDVEIGKVVFE